MIAMTVSNSMSVKPESRRRFNVHKRDGLNLLLETIRERY